MYPYIVQISLGGCLVRTWTGYANNALNACDLAEEYINPSYKPIMYHYQARKVALSTMVLAEEKDDRSIY